MLESGNLRLPVLAHDHLSARDSPPRHRKPLLPSAVFSAAAPLLLAIAGSALTPLPCAFSLAGIGMGSAAMALIGLANCYTSVLMVGAASRLGVSGYEEVVLAAGGRRALKWCRAALVVLLFGTMCGCLSAIQETGVRAIGEFAAHTGHGLAHWVASTPGGHLAMLSTLTASILMPLSLASLGELPCVSQLGVLLMAVISLYVVASAISVRALDADALAAQEGLAVFGLPRGGLALTEAASTLGYAFYVQPCAVPLLRTLPAGDEGASTLVAALYVTFALTSMAYLSVGLGGLLYFGEGSQALRVEPAGPCEWNGPGVTSGMGWALRVKPWMEPKEPPEMRRLRSPQTSVERLLAILPSAGHVPQDLLQGFGGEVGGVLAGVFCVYLMLCFSPTVVPLRETLVRLYYEVRCQD